MRSRLPRQSRSTTIRIVESALRISVCAFLAFSNLAHAESNDDARARASQSFREAKAAFARRDYGAAAAAFEQAAKLAPHPAPWLNAAEAWEKRGDLVRAAEDCDRALGVPNGDESLRKEAEGRLAQVLTHIGTLEIIGARSFSVRVDQDEAATAPFLKRVTPGAHRLLVTDLTTNQERAIDVQASAGEVAKVDLGSPSAPVATANEPAPSSQMPRPVASNGPPVASWILFGVGGAFAVATGVAGGMTLGAQSDFNAAPSQEALDRFKTDRLLTNVFLGAAVVSAGVGATIWLLGPSPREGASLRARASLSSVDLMVQF